MSHFGELIKSARERKKLTQGQVSHLCGWVSDDQKKESNPRIANYESGLRKPGIDDLPLLTSVLGLTSNEVLQALSKDANAPFALSSFSPSRVAESNATYEAEIEAWDDPDEEDGEHVSRPLFLNAELAAGSGKLDTAFDEGHRIKFSRRTLSKCGVQPENAYGMKVSGNSMEPVIPDGATAGIDAGNTAIKDGKLYAILHGEMLRVKLLYKLPGNRVRIASYNKDEYPDEVESLEGGHLKVLGRVFWYSVLI